jgi:hypothetical protein
LDGSSAFYNDPDGPNPDYINGTSANLPGGQQGTAALINPGLTPGGQVDNANALWIHRGNQWDGSAPGAPLGGPATGVPPIPPAAPGGVGTLIEGGTSFLRLQDAGDPQQWGWADKGAQASTSSPRQEGSNRRIQFAHPLARVPGYSGGTAVLDDGITLSFRTRIATAATGPLDKVYEESGPGGGPPRDWPELGVGYPVANNGRGMFMVTQNGSSGPGQIAFSLLNGEAISTGGITTTKTGLVLNNRAASAAGGSPDTNVATTASLNIVELTDVALTQWQEFWITVARLPAPDAGNTHEVKVWSNGELTPQVFQVVLGTQNEFGSGAHLGLGLSSGTRWGAFDVDYYAYRPGVFQPTLATPAIGGDFNGDGRVDGADLSLLLANWGSTTPPVPSGWNGTAPTTPAIDADELSRLLATWGVGTSLAIPEPVGAALAATGSVLFAIGVRRRSPRGR